MSERYEIKGKIARGGIGAIYRAYDTRMGRDVAIKRLLPLEETHLNESQDESIKREAAALARFQHPNVVTVYALEADADGPYVVMELVDGETLKETVERAALPVEDFSELALQLLDPLVAAKELSLLHRDIKPANIMLTWLTTGRFQIKVLDFGLSKFSHQPSLQTLDQTGSFLGSIDYLAPEQLELEPLDQRTDLYSLGCVLYFCLAQRPPFEGANAARTMQNHLSHRVTHLSELRPDVPGPIADWVMRLISRYPGDRPADAREALREFQAARLGRSPVDVAAEEEIPLAIRAVDDPGEKAGAETGGVAPPKGRTQPQLLVPSSASPAGGRTQPQLRVPSSEAGSSPKRGPVDPGASRPVNPPVERASVAGWIEHLRRRPVVTGTGAVILFLVLLFMSLPREDPPEPKPGGGDSAAGKSTGGGTGKAQNSPPKSPVPPMPQLRNQAAGNREAGIPAVTEGLVAHYAASDAVYGEDFVSPAKLGGQVNGWGNLAEGADSTHLMGVDPRFQKRGPKWATARPEDHPELAKPVPVLKFDRSTRLISHGSQQIQKRLKGDSQTLILVVRPTGNRGPFLRVDAVNSGNLLSWDITPPGYAVQMAKGSLKPRIEAKIGGVKDRFHIVSHVWKGEAVEQRIHVTLPDGYRALVAAGDAPFKPEAIQSYSIGTVSGDPQQPTFEGLVAEWLIYDRALSDEELGSVESQLARKYLNPSVSVTIDSVTPQANGAVWTARNPDSLVDGGRRDAPLADALVAHYSASDLALGHDLKLAAAVGQRVMAWGNLAKGAKPDHLLTCQSSSAGQTPLLATAPASNSGAGRPVLKFSAGDRLEVKGASKLQPRMNDVAFTAFVAMRPAEKAEGTALIFTTAEPSDAVELGFDQGGIVGRVRLGGKPFEARLPGAGEGRFVHVCLSWKAGDRTLSLRRLKPDGTTLEETAVEVSTGDLTFDGYRIGSAEGGFSGEISDLLIYRDALADDDLRRVLEYLHQNQLGR